MPTVRPTRMLPPVWLALSLLAMVALHYVAPAARLIPRPWNWLGALAIMAGVAVAVSGAALFKRYGTGVVPFSPATRLVIGGPYRFTRNPMYLGMVLLLVGVATMLATATPWIPIPLFAWWLDRRFVRQEEAMLAERFGAEYEEFKRRVRRWV